MHTFPMPYALRLKPYTILYSFLIPVLLFLIMPSCAGDQAAIKKTKRVEALQQLGMAQAAEGNLRRGLAKLLEAVKLDPDNAELNHQAAVVLRNLGNYELSLKYFNRALALKPKYPEAQNNLGTLYLVMGEWDKAIACFKDAISDILYNSPQFAYNNMGYAYFKKGDYDKAIENYKRALKASPSYTLCYANLARAYEAKGELEEAVAAYKQGVLYIPKDSASHLGLAKVLLNLDKKKEAKEELDLTIWADPAGPQAKEAREMLKGIEGLRD